MDKAVEWAVGSGKILLINQDKAIAELKEAEEWENAE